MLPLCHSELLSMGHSHISLYLQGGSEKEIMSHYIFLLCVLRVFLRLLQRLLILIDGNDYKWGEMHQLFLIIHLLMNCLLFIKDTPQGPEVLHEVLDTYALVSGQLINKQKFYIYFSNFFKDWQQDQILCCSGKQRSAEMWSYQGMPFVLGHTKK